MTLFWLRRLLPAKLKWMRHIYRSHLGPCRPHTVFRSIEMQDSKSQLPMFLCVSLETKNFFTHFLCICIYQLVTAIRNEVEQFPFFFIWNKEIVIKEKTERYGTNKTHDIQIPHILDMVISVSKKSNSFNIIGNCV